MGSSTSNRGHVAEARHQRGLIDTSVVIDLGRVDPAELPSEIAVSTVTLAELAPGPHATGDPDERARPVQVPEPSAQLPPSGLRNVSDGRDQTVRKPRRRDRATDSGVGIYAAKRVGL